MRGLWRLATIVALGLAAAGGLEAQVYETGVYGRILSRDGHHFTYDGAGRRTSDDRYLFVWDWRGQLVRATVKDTWPDGASVGQPETPQWSGHQVAYHYDAGGRLMSRLHYGRLPEGVTDDSRRPFIEKREYVWEWRALVAEAAYGQEGTDASLRWRKTYVPGPSGLDDAPQVVVEQGGVAKTYTYIRDELSTVIAIVAEDESSDPRHPSIPVRYLYSPYGEAHAESGPELGRAHLDHDLNAVGEVAQTIADPRTAVRGTLVLDWSLGLNPASLATGIVVERQVAAGWSPLGAQEVLVSLDQDNRNRVLVMAISGWAASTSYRVRIGQEFRDGLGRSVVRPPKLEWRTADAPPAGELQRIYFDKRIRKSYESWEAAQNTVGGRFPSGQTSLFQGLYTDEVTGLSYARARWYDARTANFLSEDPRGSVDSPNLYAFVGWMPNTWRDPLGLERPSPTSMKADRMLQDWILRENQVRGAAKQTRIAGVVQQAYASAVGLPGATENQRRDAFTDHLSASLGLNSAVDLTMATIGPAGMLESDISKVMNQMTPLLASAQPILEAGAGLEMILFGGVLPEAGAALRLGLQTRAGAGRALYHYTSVDAARAITGQGRILASEAERPYSLNAQGVGDAGSWLPGLGMGDRSTTRNVFFTDVPPSQMTKELAVDLGIADMSAVIRVQETALRNAGIPLFQNPRNAKIFNAVAPEVPVGGLQ